MKRKEVIHQLEKIRRIRGLNQRELAKIVGVKESYISLIEGGRSLSGRMIADLSNVLNCSTDQLLGKQFIDDNLQEKQRVSKAEGSCLKLVSENQYPVKDEYMRYAVETIEKLVAEKELKPQHRIDILPDLYKMIYDFFEHNRGKEEYEQFVKEREKSLDVNKTFLEFAKNKKIC